MVSDKGIKYDNTAWLSFSCFANNRQYCAMFSLTKSTFRRLECFVMEALIRSRNVIRKYHKQMTPATMYPPIHSHNVRMRIMFRLGCCLQQSKPHTPSLFLYFIKTLEWTKYKVKHTDGRLQDLKYPRLIEVNNLLHYHLPPLALYLSTYFINLSRNFLRARVVA